jgi:integrase
LVASTPDVHIVVSFLTSLFSLGLSYSALVTARAAVNAYTSMCGHVDFSENKIIKKFMKGIFNKRPNIPKHPELWDVNIVFNYICQVENDSLMFLSGKLCLLFLLLSAQRCQTLHLINVNDLKVMCNQIIVYPNHLLKQSRPNYHLEPIILEHYAKNKKLCIVNTMKEYLDRTDALRSQEEKKLLISTQAPHRGVAKSTVARWVKSMLMKAGIDSSFTTHSTRAVATSLAKQKGVSMDRIAKSAGWSNAKTFFRYYKKPFQNDLTVQKAILG